MGNNYIKTCPLNSHQDCEEELCAFWDKEAQKPGCSILHVCRAICDIANDIDIAVNRQGIAVYIKHDGHQ